MKRARLWVTVLLQVATVASPLVARGEPTTPFVLNDNHPIIVDGQLFGGSRNSRWVAREGFSKTKKGKEITPARGEPISVDMALLQGTETLRFYDGTAFVGQGVASRVRYGLDEHGNELYEVRAQVAGAAATPWRVALNGSWNGLPRPFREVKPQRLYVGDLDGDGREERVRVQLGKGLSASAASQTPSAALPSYTLIFEMNGKSASFTSIDVDGTDTRDWSLLAVDCDGDGKMELLLTTSGNAASMELYEIRQGKPKLVLAVPPD